VTGQLNIPAIHNGSVISLHRESIAGSGLAVTCHAPDLNIDNHSWMASKCDGACSVLFDCDSIPSVLEKPAYRLHQPRASEILNRFSKEMVMRLAFYVAIAALMVVGCGKKGPSIQRHAVQPVEGQVIWKQTPLAGAYVTFHPRGWEEHAFSNNPAATTGPDGRYRLGTYSKDDGAPAGKYVITVTCPDHSPTAPKMYPPNILPKQYSSPDTSGLEVEIVEGANVVPPLDLGGKPDAEGGKKSGAK
jgi:hypothetical protein